MKYKRIVLTIAEDDDVLAEWFDSIPTRFRSTMLKIALLNAINNGLADMDTIFPRGRVPKADAGQEPVDRGDSIPETPEKERAVAREKPEKKPASSKAENAAKATPVAPEGSSEEELIAFTLAHLPEGATQEMREAAREYYRATPYTMEELVKLTKMYAAERRFST